jgi:hypothetical protein
MRGYSEERITFEQRLSDSVIEQLKRLITWDLGDSFRVIL